MPRVKTIGKKNTDSLKKNSAKGSKASKSEIKKKTAPADGGVKIDKQKRRFRPGTVALREIKRYQKSTSMVLLRAPFQRLVRSISTGVDPSFRF